MKALCESIEASILFDDISAKPIAHMAGVVSYLSKECTPQAWGASGFSVRREQGSHKLPGGGDRVRLSRTLEAELIEAGRIEKYAKSYSKRAAPRIDVEGLTRDFERARIGLFFVDDLPEAPLTKPKAAIVPRKREKIVPPSLPIELPSLTDTLAGLGPTHQAIADCVGISRQQATNIIVGRFGMSRQVARRLLALSRAAA